MSFGSNLGISPLFYFGQILCHNAVWCIWSWCIDIMVKLVLILIVEGGKCSNNVESQRHQSYWYFRFKDSFIARTLFYTLRNSYAIRRLNNQCSVNVFWYSLYYFSSGLSSKVEEAKSYHWRVRRVLQFQLKYFLLVWFSLSVLLNLPSVSCLLCKIQIWYYL